MHYNPQHFVHLHPPRPSYRDLRTIGAASCVDTEAVAGVMDIDTKRPSLGF